MTTNPTPDQVMAGLAEAMANFIFLTRQLGVRVTGFIVDDHSYSLVRSLPQNTGMIQTRFDNDTGDVKVEFMSHRIERERHQ